HSFLLSLPPSHVSTLFPYTTLFRSRQPRHPTLYSSPRSRFYRPGKWWHPECSIYCCPVFPARRQSVPACWRFAQRHRRRGFPVRSEEHTSELQSRFDLVCRLLLEKK